jgi:ABC-type arginine transport system permease subunit
MSLVFVVVVVSVLLSAATLATSFAALAKDTNVVNFVAKDGVVGASNIAATFTGRSFPFEAVNSRVFFNVSAKLSDTDSQYDDGSVARRGFKLLTSTEILVVWFLRVF